MSRGRPKHRLFVAEDLAAGRQFALGPEQSHYLANVMRAGKGAELAILNGRDGEWLARLAEVNKRAAEIEILERLRPQTAGPDLWLAFAPMKGGRLDFLVEKATELGAAVLLPTFMRHSAVQRVNAARLRAQAVEAAEQSERLTVPEVKEPVEFPELLAAWPKERRLYFLDETGDGAPLAAIIEREGPRPAGFLAGPEGGIAKSELDALRDLPFAVGVALGPRILRAETAALAALSCWQALAGDGNEKPPRRS